MEKKRRLKEMFDQEYDVKGDSEFYDSWKSENEQQAQVGSQYNHIVSLEFTSPGSLRMNSRHRLVVNTTILSRLSLRILEV